MGGGIARGGIADRYMLVLPLLGKQRTGSLVHIVLQPHYQSQHPLSSIHLLRRYVYPPLLTHLLPVLTWPYLSWRCNHNDRLVPPSGARLSCTEIVYHLPLLLLPLLSKAALVSSAVVGTAMSGRLTYRSGAVGRGMVTGVLKLLDDDITWIAHSGSQVS